MSRLDTDIASKSSRKPRVSRRLFLSTAAAVTVIGYSSASGWISEAEAETLDTKGERLLRRLPPLRGTVTREAAGFITDFGREVSAQPMAVLHPEGVRDIVAMCRFCTLHGITMAMNGQSGEPNAHESHSNYGQALTKGGLQINARKLAGIRRLTKGRAVVGAGTTWAELVDAALKTGQTVASLPDYLNLSIGGTVSVGGVGGNVQRAGLCADLVREIQIVTPAGIVYRASRHRFASLFRAALGGGGQYGVITELTLDLVPAQEMATITSLYYSSSADYLRDQRTLLQVKDLQHHTGEFIRTKDDTAWNFKIDLGVYHPSGQARSLDDLLSGLNDDRARRSTVTMPYRDWAFRTVPFTESISKSGHLEMKKPWVSFLIPGDRVQEFVDWVSPQLSQRDLGAGLCLLSPLASGSIATEMFMMPESSDGVVFFFDLLAFPDPGTPDVDGMFERNRRFHRKVIGLGGKRYIIGAVPGLTQADWVRHYKPSRYYRLSMLKRIHDPRGVLTPGQGIFPWVG